MDIFPNGTVLFQWLLFMMALIALNYGVFRPVLHIIRERRERTDGERAKAEELLRRSEQLMEQCEGRLQEARREGMKERSERLREGIDQEKAILSQARQEVGQEMDKMRHELEQQTRAASLHLKQYGEEIGHEIAERLLGRKV